MDHVWIPLLSAIAGSIIGGLTTGYFALKSTNRAHENQLEIAAKNENKLIRGVLQAIHDEIETVFERYQKFMGEKLEALKDGEPLLVYYPLISDFFTVYNGNSFLIGRISDNDLRKQIIKTYTLAKGLVDSFRMNNELNQKYEYWIQIFHQAQNPINQQMVLGYRASLVDYAKNMKIAHHEAKSETEKLLKLLEEQGVLTEK